MELDTGLYLGVNENSIPNIAWLEGAIPHIYNQPVGKVQLKQSQHGCYDANPTKHKQQHASRTTLFRASALFPFKTNTPI
jgi:hypothetical protein